jgi:hypothetical protein
MTFKAPLIGTAPAALVVAAGAAAVNANVRAVMQAGNCKKHGASFATVGSARANANGVARWSASVLFRTEPVAWDVIADGAHVFRIVGGARALACGVVPGMD